MKTFDVKHECKACDGTGLYVGICERDGAAVVCNKCKGTGEQRTIFKYKEFEGRQQPTKKVKRVYEVNIGIVIGEDEQLKLSDFGGMPFADWNDGKPFPKKSENRECTCPAWWYQSVDYDKKPRWKDEERSCIGIGSFSNCEFFNQKDGCWGKWDEEYD